MRPSRLPLLSPALPPAAPNARFEIRAAGFRAFLLAYYGDLAAPCIGSPLTVGGFFRLYQCATPEELAGCSLTMIEYTRGKWSRAWLEYVARSGL